MISTKLASQKSTLNLKLARRALFEKATSAATSTYETLGAFVLLAHDLSSSHNIRPSTFGMNVSRLLSSTLNLLRNAFLGGLGGSNITIGEDESLFWVWWCIEAGAVKEGEELEEQILFTLVEVSFASSFLFGLGSLLTL